MNIKKEVLVSIIVPIYNSKDFLDRCITSLVTQSYKNLEILLIDDGSTDNSGEICDEWQKKDYRIRVFHKENGGVSSARNIGLKSCKGEYVAFVDCDDFVKQNYVEVLLNSVVENKCDMAIINLIEKYRDSTEKEIKFSTEKKLLNRYDFLDNITNKNGYQGYSCNKIFSKKIIDENNLIFDENIYYSEDLLFVVKFAEKAEKIYYEFDENLYYYCINEQSSTQVKMNNKLASSIKIYDQIINIFEENDVDPILVKVDYITMYFYSLDFFDDDKDFYKKKYKKICKEYFFEILNSKKVSFYKKVKIIGIVYLPKIMKIIKILKERRA